MKEYLRQMLQGVESPLRARCLVREYLQARLLQVLQEKHAFASWAFVGGTALRFLYNLPRFSEDLDFSLVDIGVEDRFRDILSTAKQVFAAEDYDVVIKLKDEKTVKSAFIRFSGLLFDLDLSTHASERLAIKVEIDTNPPNAAVLETTVVRRHVLLNLRHYDRASLLAGKLHAVFTRAYTKGRDIYDLVWYLSDRSWPSPNLALLNNALQQTGSDIQSVDENNWRSLLLECLERLDWGQVVHDVHPFIERQEEEAFLTHDHLVSLLKRNESF